MSGGLRASTRGLGRSGGVTEEGTHVTSSGACSWHSGASKWWLQSAGQGSTGSKERGLRRLLTPVCEWQPRVTPLEGEASVSESTDSDTEHRAAHGALTCAPAQLPHHQRPAR